MLRDLLMAFGLMAVIEGLVLALAPFRFEQLLEMFRDMGRDRLRVMALSVIAAGVGLIWLAQHVG